MTTARGVMLVAIGMAIAMPLLSLGCRQSPSHLPPRSTTASPKVNDKPADDAGKLIGVVQSRGQPIANARVRMQGGLQHVLTDHRGQFELPKGGKRARITAAKEGFFISSSVGDDQPVHIELRPIPTSDDHAYAWVDPTPDPAADDNCGNCHQQIYDEWSLGAHGRSARNRHLLSYVDGTDWQGRKSGWSLIDDYPEGKSVCLPCHVPTSAEQATSENLADIGGVSQHGVHCDFCHKVKDVDIEDVGISHGFFSCQLLRPSHDQLFFGPLDDVDRGEDVYSSIMSQSKMCAPCHEGTVFGVHVYSTYSEWLDSRARQNGMHCQSCHMTPTGQMTNFAPGHGGIERDPQSLASHTLFPGGQAEMLRSCLKLNVTADRDEDATTVRVEIKTRNVGHRVPTGFIDRNLILVVDTVLKDEQIEQLAGGRLGPLVGTRLEGQAGFLFAKRPLDSNGTGPVPFWSEDIEVIDTRLKPDDTWSGEFRFAGSPRLRVRLIYRRFWEQVSAVKQFPSNETIVHQHIGESP